MRESPMQRSRGFSLIELLVVLGIIGVSAAIAVPNVISYLRTYRIRSAAQELATNINVARTRAILKSGNYGVDFVVEDATTYWVHNEDIQATTAGGRQELDFASPDAGQSSRFVLTDPIVFATTAAECNSAAGFVPNATGFRFTRLGGRCAPGSTACPAIPLASGSTAAAVVASGTTGNPGSMVCLRDPRTGLAWRVSVSTGGRVEELR
jgi:prepilin-type N-terminal cleavage/methylation domain-containing protein